MMAGKSGKHIAPGAGPARKRGGRKKTYARLVAEGLVPRKRYSDIEVSRLIRALGLRDKTSDTLAYMIRKENKLPPVFGGKAASGKYGYATASRLAKEKGDLRRVFSELGPEQRIALWEKLSARKEQIRNELYDVHRLKKRNALLDEWSGLEAKLEVLFRLLPKGAK